MSAQHRKAVREQVFSRDGWRCQYCGASVAEEGVATVDHIQPKSLGGKYMPDNLRTSCFDCNFAKGDRSTEWLRMYLAFSRLPIARVITLEQYHQLRGMGAGLPALDLQPFLYEQHFIAEAA